MADKVQNYANHTRLVPLYHVVTSLLLLATFIGACVNLYKSLGDSSRVYSASLLVTLTAATILVSFFARNFALKAQDRAIRAEEQLRHYVMSGKLLDSRLTLRQIIGLRFASNDEFLALCQRAAEQGLSEDEIKKAVKSWRVDAHRA
jgi:hypothetical protein